MNQVVDVWTKKIGPHHHQDVASHNLMAFCLLYFPVSLFLSIFLFCSSRETQNTNSSSLSTFYSASLSPSSRSVSFSLFSPFLPSVPSSTLTNALYSVLGHLRFIIINRVSLSSNFNPRLSHGSIAHLFDFCIRHLLTSLTVVSSTATVTLTVVCRGNYCPALLLLWACRPL